MTEWHKHPEEIPPKEGVAYWITTQETSGKRNIFKAFFDWQGFHYSLLNGEEIIAWAEVETPLPFDGTKEELSQRADYYWFLKNIKSLFKTYGHAYLLIKDRKVIGSYKTYSEGVEEGAYRFGMGDFIVQECVEDENELAIVVY